MREPFLTRLTELLEKAVDVSLKTLMGAVLGLHLIQAMVLPYADGAAQAGARRVLEMIPGLGAGASAAAQVVLGSGVLIKNSIGAAGAIVLGLLVLAPAVKLGGSHGPVSVRGPLSWSLSVISAWFPVRQEWQKGHWLLLKIQLYSLLLFLLAICHHLRGV